VLKDLATGAELQPYAVPVAVDVWSMGVLLYLCVAGQYPFECKATPDNLTATLRNVLAGHYHPLPPGTPLRFAVARQLLCEERPVRPSALLRPRGIERNVHMR